MPKARPFPDALLARLAREHGTPLYVQGAAGVRRQIARLAGFDVVRYAMKANSSIALLEVIRGAGAQVDCVSAGEIARALSAGWAPEETCFTADLFSRASLEAVARYRVPVNLGSLDMIEQYAAAVREDGPRGVTIRLNPGFGHGHSKKVNTGGDETKHGIHVSQLGEARRRAEAAGLHLAGLHMHIGSGTDLDHLRRVRDAMVAAAREAGDRVEAVSPGGGLPVPYREGEDEFDVEGFTEIWREARGPLTDALGRAPRIEVEPGRYLVAEAGCLLTEVRAVKEVAGHPCALVDAGFNDVCRPMVYGAFHQVSIVGRDDEPAAPTLVAGPLCESSDVLTQGPGGAPLPQPLPAPRIGDLLCVHDTGAYAASMASNYNSMPIAAEVLVEDDGAVRLARPRQSIDALVQAELDALGRAHPEAPFTHAGGIVARLGQGGIPEILVVRSSSWTGETDEWVLPKGHIDPGETAETAALREVREEAGARCDEPRFLGRVEYHAKGEDVACAFFAMTLVELGEPEEERDRTWLGVEEARRKVPFPETFRLIEAAARAASSRP